MKILEFKSASEFLDSFACGDLKGYTPAEKIDTKTLKYPIKVDCYDDLKVFALHKEEVKAEVKAEPKKSNKKLILGLSIGIPLGVIAIIGIVLMCIYL